MVSHMSVKRRFLRSMSVSLSVNPPPQNQSANQLLKVLRNRKAQRLSWAKSEKTRKERTVPVVQKQ